MWHSDQPGQFDGYDWRLDGVEEEHQSMRPHSTNGCGGRRHAMAQQDRVKRTPIELPRHPRHLPLKDPHAAEATAGGDLYHRPRKIGWNVIRATFERDADVHARASGVCGDRLEEHGPSIGLPRRAPVHQHYRPLPIVGARMGFGRTK